MDRRRCPKRLAGNVGALRGVANNISNALAAAFASVVAVGLLSLFLASAFNQSELPPELKIQVLFDDVDFMTNDRLRSALTTPEIDTGLYRRGLRLTLGRICSGSRQWR